MKKKNISTISSLNDFRWAESYTSLLLGILVVVIATILVVSLFRLRRDSGLSFSTKEISSQKTEKVIKKAELPTYTVVSGDDLWNIAVQRYGDGFRWVDIAGANNITNPDSISTGDVLKIPR